MVNHSEESSAAPGEGDATVVVGPAPDTDADSGGWRTPLSLSRLTRSQAKMSARQK